MAFERLLDNGEKFASRLLSGFSDVRTWPQLMNIATDGETYGHHHRFGEMALAWALRHIDSNGPAKITNYAEFLEKNPPTRPGAGLLKHRLELCDGSAGRPPTARCKDREPALLRMEANCTAPPRAGAQLGCAIPWRPLYEQRAAAYLRYPWQARNDYIQVVLDRSPERRRRFLARHATRELTDKEVIEVWKLLEMQRHAMLMYTSCGWFFAELSGIETVQVIQYAGRVVQLAEDVAGSSIEPEFLQRLARARSNVPERRDGAVIDEALREARHRDAAARCGSPPSARCRGNPEQGEISSPTPWRRRISGPCAWLETWLAMGRIGHVRHYRSSSCLLSARSISVTTTFTPISASMAAAKRTTAPWRSGARFLPRRSCRGDQPAGAGSGPGSTPSNLCFATSSGAF